MLGWALTFLVVALIAALLGFGGIAGTAVGIAKIIFFVAIVLFLITVMEVSTYYLEPPRSVLIPVLFVFTVVKFALVVMWFMHLKFDSRVYSRFFVMGIAFAVTLYIVVLMLFGAFTGGT